MEDFKERIKKWNEDDHVFYRFQMRGYAIGNESWGMIYNSREEAIEAWMDENDCDYETAESEAILPGKSCMPTLEEIWEWVCSFSDNDYLLVFRGLDTGVSGHDGEYVAEFEEEIARFPISQVFEFVKTCEWWQN